MRYALASLVVMTVLVALLAWSRVSPDSSPLQVSCAAALQPAIAECARRFEQATGRLVRVQYGGSQSLLANAELSGRGDVYIPADDEYLRFARAKGLVGESVPIARMRPTVAVRRGNPLGIRTTADLERTGMRLSLADPDLAAIGRLARERLTACGTWDAVRARVVVTRPTVGDAVNDVKLGAADAAFAWDATVAHQPDLEAIMPAELEGTVAVVAAAVLKSSRRPDIALEFARYLAAADGGRSVFVELGYTPSTGSER